MPTITLRHLSERKRLLTRRVCVSFAVAYGVHSATPLTNFNQNANHSINAAGNLGTRRSKGLIQPLLQVRAFPAAANFPARGVPSSDSRKFIKKCHCGLVRRSQIAGGLKTKLANIHSLKQKIALRQPERQSVCVSIVEAHSPHARSLSLSNTHTHRVKYVYFAAMTHGARSRSARPTGRRRAWWKNAHFSAQ